MRWRKTGRDSSSDSYSDSHPYSYDDIYANCCSTTPKPTDTHYACSDTNKGAEALYFWCRWIWFSRVLVSNGSSSYKIIFYDKFWDTVKWVSITDNNYYLTVVSKEGLWNNSTSMMKYRFRFFNYTFNQSGEYEVYIKEFPRETHQKIVVNHEIIFFSFIFIMKQSLWSKSISLISEDGNVFSGQTILVLNQCH